MSGIEAVSFNIVSATLGLPLDLDRVVINTDKAHEKIIETQNNILLEGMGGTSNSKTKKTQSTSASESAVIAQTKTLAEVLGVSVSSGDSISQMLNKIAYKIDSLLIRYANDPEKLLSVRKSHAILQSLQNDYMTLSGSQNSTYTGLQMISASNRVALNLV